MRKEDFLEIYRNPRITLGAFDDNKFLDSDVVIELKRTKISDFKDYYCPWYSKNDKEVSYKEACEDNNARALTFKDEYKINLDVNRKEIIANRDLPEKLEPIPIALDINSGKRLVLDSNKTCVALFRKYQEEHKDIYLDVVEISLPDMGLIIGDFNIVNRD